MLPKAKRLSRSGFLKRHQRTVPFLFGSIKIIEGEGQAAVVISKKVAPLAVSRNQLRRRVYAILRPYVAKSSSFIVYPNKKALGVPFATLKEELVRALGHC